MARIVCVTSGLTGLLHSSVELARRLVAAGHDVTFASASAAATTVRTHGITFVPIDVDGYERFLATDATRGRWTRLLRVGDRRRQAARAMGGERFVDLLRAVAPDLVLIDAEMHAHVMTAAASGYRTALLVTFVSIWRRPGLPPPHHLVVPGKGWRGQPVGIWLLWVNLRLKKWRVILVERIGRIGCDRVSVLRQVARDIGFDVGREVDDRQWLIPFTYRRIPALCTHALEFEFPHEPAAHVSYLGPLVLESPGDDRVDALARARLEVVLARRRTGGPKRRLIYAGFGSFFTTSTTFVRRLLEAVALRSDWDLVLSLGGRAPAADLGPIPANVCLMPWVPQHEVLRHTDVVVTHGGINTVDECVVAGVPMLVYCGFQTDMGGTTARVAYHGIGLVGDPHGDTPEVIGHHIDRLLEDPGFRQRVERLQSQYDAYRTNHIAENIVAALLERHPAATRGSSMPSDALQ